MVDSGGRLELYESKWTELPSGSDTINLSYVRNIVGKSRVSMAAVICRTTTAYPTDDGFRGIPVTAL